MTGYGKMTHNVFITKSLPAIEQVHFAKHKLKTGSFHEKLNTLSKEDLSQSFVASPFRNDGLLSFEYSFQANGKNGGHTVTVKLLETSQLLEMFLFENDPLARMLDAKQDYLNSKTQEKDKTGEAIPLFKGENKSLLSGKTGTSFNEKKKMMSRFYMSFGTGDDISKWSGPYTMDLVVAQLSNDKFNNRIIELVFIPNKHSFKSWSSKFSAEFGYKDDFRPTDQYLSSPDSFQVCTGRSRIDLTRREPTTPPQRPNDDRRKLKTGNEQYNFDYRIRDVIKKYIGAFTLQKSQVVVVLPHLFGNCRVITDSQKKSLAKELPGAGFSNVFGDHISEGMLGNMGFKISFTDDFQYSRKSRDIDDYLTSRFEEITQAPTLQSEFDFNKLNRSLANQQFNLQEFIEKETAAYEEAVPKVYDSEIAKMYDDYSKRVSRIQEQEINGLALVDDPTQPASILQQEEPTLYYLASVEADANSPVGRGTPEQVRAVLRQKILERAVSDADAALETRKRKEIQAEDKRDRALDVESQDYVEFETDLYNKVEQRRLMLETGMMRADGSIPNVFGGVPAPQDPLAITGGTIGFKNISTNNPSLLGYGGSIDEVKNQLNPPGDTGVLKKYNILNEYNVGANWDLVTDTLQDLLEVKNETFNLVMESRNESAKDDPTGFTPLISPLVRFSDGLKSLDNVLGVETETRYDFYEETDMRILELWYKHGFIADKSKPAYVFGDMNTIKSLLYLEGESDPHEMAVRTVFDPEYFNDRNGSRVISYGSFGNSVQANPLSVSFGEQIRVDRPERTALIRYDHYKSEFNNTFNSDTDTPIVLRHNMQNSNVLSLDYSIDNYYAAMLNMPVSPLLDIQSIGSTRKKVIKDELKSVLGSTGGKVAEQLAKYRSEPDFLSFLTKVEGSRKNSLDMALAIVDDLADEKVSDTKVKDQFDLFIIMFLYLNADKLPDGDSTLGVQTKAQNMSRYYQTIARQTSKLLVQCKARALPNFNKKSFIGRKVRIDGKTGGIVGNGIEDVEVKDARMRDAPYNGTYTAIGYKHLITPTNAYSEYDCVRGAANMDVPASQTVKNYVCGILNEYVDSAQLPIEIAKAEIKAEMGGAMVALPQGYAEDPDRAFRISQGLPPGAKRTGRNNKSKYASDFLDRVKEALNKLGCNGDATPSTDQANNAPSTPRLPPR
jgi:hypothetical protein